MPACTLCGRSVVPFLSAHLRCKRANRAGREELVALADRLLGAAGAGDEVARAVERLERDAFVTRAQRGELLRARFEERVREALEDSVLTVEEEAQLLEFTEAFALGKDELDRDGWYTRFVQSAALRDLLHGKLPPSILPMTLEPGEALIWMFPSAQYTEGAVLRQVQEPAVPSIRVSSGLYYRIAEPTPQSRERTVQRPIDAGSLGVTNRYVHFTGLRNRFRLPLEELDQLEPTKQGVSFRRVEGRGKSEGFETGDGWFLMNLLSNARNARSA